MLQVGGHCVCNINSYVHVDVYQRDTSIGNHRMGEGSWTNNNLTIGVNFDISMVLS